MIDRQDALDTFRGAVMDALDEAAREVFGDKALAATGGQGATDADLPDLFRAIDAQVERLAERYDEALVDVIEAKPFSLVGDTYVRI